MNLPEFKAWFEGYTENMKGAPTAKQWERIKARVEEIKAQPTEVRYFYDHYWRPYYHGYVYTNALTTGYASNATTATVGMHNAAMTVSNSLDAFRMLGKADSISEAA